MSKGVVVLGSYNQGPTNILPPGTDTQYINLVVPPRNLDANGNVPATFISQFSQPILYNPQDYLLAMIRFQISGINIPIMIPRIKPFPNTNVNETIYSVTLQIGNNISQAPVIFNRTDFTSPIPAAPTANNPNVEYTPYYFIYEYTDFLEMINQALRTAFAGLAGKPANSEAPYFIYNPSIQRISLIAQQAFYDLQVNYGQFTPPPANPILVYINTPLFRYLDGIPIIDRGTNTPDGRDIQFNIRNLNDSNWYITPGPLLPNNPNYIDEAIYLEMTQEYDALSDWNCLQTVQLESSTLPINKEVVPSIKSNNQGEITSLGILADFIPLVVKGPEFRTDISYVANGSFRYIDLIGSSPINKADLTFYWVDDVGEQRLIYTPPYKLATAKMMFIRKDLVGSIALTG